MLFDPTILVRQPLPVLATLFVILIGKSVAALLIVLAFRHPLSTAMVISASLAQIGEFSFILAGLGVALELLTAEARDLVLAGALISILLNPLVFRGALLLRPALERTLPKAVVTPPQQADASAQADAEDAAIEAQRASEKGHAVLVGYGRVGGVVGKDLMALGQPFVVIEDNDRLIAELAREGIEAVPGNAVESRVLDAARIAEARMLFLAIPNCFEAGQVVERARARNPGIVIVARAHSDDEVSYLTKLGSNAVIMGEREIARGMIEHAFGGPEHVITPTS
jgi:CPA2 family monovalent cation:H+ antiporter-2